MKKLVGIALGLSLVLGCAGCLARADDAAATKATKTKATKTKATHTKKAKATKAANEAPAK